MANANTSADHDEQLALLVSELSDRVQRGEAVDLEEECRRQPELAGDLRELWGVIVVARAAGSHSAGPAPTLPSDHASDFPSGSLTLPAKFGDYELLEELGRGGMGVVYRARQLSLNRDVAVKMILRGQLASQADRERFEAEAQAAARLDHPGIVPVYEVGELDGRPYFSMKYVRGTTLAQRLADGPLPPREAAPLLAAVARAIHFAHMRGVLHRDLKPSNILLDAHGEPHVTDFGLAKQITDAADADQDRRGPRHAGLHGPGASRRHSAGRSARRATSTRSASILYHMLTGRPPFQAASPVDTVLTGAGAGPGPAAAAQPQGRPRPGDDLPALPAEADRPALRHRRRAGRRPGSVSERRKHLGPQRPLRPGARRLMRETHHAAVLENWGLLWMWHSLALLGRLLRDEHVSELLSATRGPLASTSSSGRPASARGRRSSGPCAAAWGR